MSQETPAFVLDVVLEGVPSPRSGDADRIWPEPLPQEWRVVELPPASEDGSDPRRAWRVRDPESDLELTVIWAAGPGDPEEQAQREQAAELAAELEREHGEDGEGHGDEGPLPEGWLLFGHSPRPGSRSDDLLRVCELALRLAERLGLKLFDPTLGETFEVEDWAFRLTEPFHPRAYLATHWVRGDVDRASWIHTHGMDRFGLPDLETFGAPDEDGEDVVAFLHEAAEAWIRNDAPSPSPRARTIDGVKVRVLDATAARRGAPGWSPESWEGHEGPFVAVEPAGAWKEALSGWRPSSVRRSPGLIDRLCAITGEILPEVRRRFETDGAHVKVKARFPVRGTSPESGPAPGFESMWVHVEAWTDERIRGRLVNEPEVRSDLGYGTVVDVAPDEVWDVLVVKDGRPYRGVSLRRWLRA